MNRVRTLVQALGLSLFAVLAASASLAEQGTQPAVAKQKDFPGIEKLMTAEEFKRGGLDKLTPEELQALDAWLVRYTAGEAKVVQSTSAAVKEAEGAQDVRIVAHLLPPFTGWTGDTIFRLDNGQVWRQRIDGRYSYRGDPPEVVITRNFFGYYVMTLPGVGRAIGVEPVR